MVVAHKVWAFFFKKWSSSAVSGIFEKWPSRTYIFTKSQVFDWNIMAGLPDFYSKIFLTPTHCMSHLCNGAGGCGLMTMYNHSLAEKQVRWESDDERLMDKGGKTYAVGADDYNEFPNINVCCWGDSNEYPNCRMFWGENMETYP